MDNAERQLSNAPDSALNTMRSIRKIAIVLPERRARYGLLYSIALDKNYIDIAADSLIRFSTQYYDHKGSPEQRMRAYYYLGRTQENAGDHLAATLSFLDAAQYLDQVDDNYLKGLLCSKLGQMYAINDRNELAFNTIEKSYYYYKSIGLKKHQAYELYSLGKLCHSLNKFTEGIDLLNNAIKLADEIDYEAIKPYCYPYLILLYDANNQYDEAYKVIRLLNSKNFDDYTLYIGAAAHTLHRKGKILEAKNLMNYGWSVAKNARDSSVMFHYQSKIHLYNKNIKSYLTSYSWAVNLQLKEATKLKENKLDATYTEYIRQKQIKVQKNTNKRKNTYIIILLVGITLSVFIVLQRLHRTRQLQKEIEKDLAIIDDIRKDYQRIGEKLLKQTKSQFEIFDQLCLTFYQYSIDEKKQKYVYKELQTLIKNFSKDTIIIEKNLNEAHDNIIAKLRAELPELTENDIRLACYILSGFSNQTIAVFLSCEYSAATTRRSRLKSKILNAHTPNNELFKIIFK